jgi:hypothetical protein
LVGIAISGVIGFILGLLLSEYPILVLLIPLLALVILLGGREALSYIVIIVGFLVGIITLYTFRSLLGIGLLGLSVMVGFLIGNNIISEKKDYSKAEIRRSIALSIMAIFFALIAFGNEIKVEGILKDVLSNYWKLVAVVIGFYFGGRSAERIVEIILTSKNKKRD